ncbi:MAG: hypothetical protein KDC98_25100 [Planctomycetes bacterium]|nr:hypothetical protein [Planctomycetota bacterium]
MNYPRILVLSLLLAPCTLAQRAVVVDGLNGPGTSHTTIDAAMLDLRQGDVITVRAGTYYGGTYTTPYSFVLVGEGSPTVQPVDTQHPALDLTCSGGDHQRVSVKGMRFESQNTGQWAIALKSNFLPPAVHLEDCIAESTSPQADRNALYARSVWLTVARCTLATTQIQDASAAFTDCTIIGHSQDYYAGVISQHAQSALDVIRSKVWVADCALSAGDSHFVTASPPACVHFADNTSSTYSSSQLFLSGNTTLRADQEPSASVTPPDVLHNNHYYYPAWPAVTHEPTVTFVPAPGGAVFGQSITNQTGSVPSLRTTPAALGGSWICTVHGPVGELAGLAIGFASWVHEFQGFPMLLDHTQSAIAGFATLGATGSAQFAFPLPNDPAFRGLVFEGQGALISPLGAIAATNPASGIVW